MSHARQHHPVRRPARQRLLAAAEDLFYTQGITSTGVDAVIEHAGVAIGSLYKNFGSKDALVAAYLQERHDRWCALWEACIAECTDPVDRVLAIFTAMERFDQTVSAGHGCAHVAAAVQLAEDHPGARVAAHHKRHLTDRLHQLCSEIGATDPDEIANDVLLIYEGMHTMITMHLDPDPISRARHLAARRLLKNRIGNGYR